MRQTLSVVLATYNEEKNLAACLDTLSDIADEIVIVDGTSSDKTAEIAKKYKAKVKITTNKANFHINKQMAIDLASKDWILQMDADEHVSDDLKKEIKEILENDPKEYNGYWMPRKNLFLGRFLMKGGQYPDYTLRFYRKGKGRLPQKDVHEQAVVEGKVGYFKTALLHYPYKKFANYLAKWDRYNDLFATQIKEEQQSKNILEKVFYAFAYLFIKPAHWFLTTYIRHKGFMDSWQGFIFSLFSALRFPVSYIKFIGPYKFFVSLILIISAIIRLWNFPQRWGLGGDDSRDAMIALEALKRHQPPLMGPFSSAGPFVFGGIYYWVIMASYILLPNVIFAPWIFMEILSVFTVALLIYLGKILAGNRFSLIIGILAAFSPQLVVRSLALGPHTFVATLTALTLISFILLWQKKKIIYAFLMGLFIGLAISFHYQALNLLIFIPALLLVSSLTLKRRIFSLITVLIGLIIPSMPLLYWDYHQGFANTRNILDYFFVVQYRIYVPNSWKLFLFKDIPAYWSFVVGNVRLMGLILFFLSFAAFLLASVKRKINLIFFILGLIFSALLFLNRFYKGERSEGYLLYLLPFILVFSAFVFNEAFNLKNKWINFFSVTVIILIIFLNSFYIFSVWNNKNSYPLLKQISISLSKKYPGNKFSIYDYKYKFYSSSMALSLVMGLEGKVNNEGMKIGLDCYGKRCAQGLPTVNKDGLLIVDLSNVKESDFDKKKQLWINVNQPSAYDDLIGWLNKNQLKSTFSLQNYIMDRVK